MFTGLIADRGHVLALDATGEGAVLEVRAPLAAELAAGESVAVNGVCLTARAADATSFSADVMHETLRRTSLGELRAGAEVNLELALRMDQRLGGHIVQGHVDAVGTVAASHPDGLATVLTISAPAGLLRYVVAKGSIAVDGISLTVARVDDAGFDVSLIPETLARTTLGRAAPGAHVNLEVDLLAKYVEKLAGSHPVRAAQDRPAEIAEGVA